MSDDASLHSGHSKRRPVNLTIRADVLADAKALKLNASKAAETGIIAAVKKAREAEWLRTSKEAIQAHNERVDRIGTLLPPSWERD